MSFGGWGRKRQVAAAQRCVSSVNPLDRLVLIRLTGERRDCIGSLRVSVGPLLTPRPASPMTLAAAVALRSMVDFTLAEAPSSRYGDATRPLQSCGLFSKRIEDGGDISRHEAFMAAMSSGHARKSAFWQRMRELGMS